MDSRSEQILVLEDNPIDGVLVEYCLTKNGYRVTSSPAATEALIAATKVKFDLIVTDYNLPGCSGTDFVRQLRGLDGYKLTPVILLTSSAHELDWERLCNDLGLVVLPKGFDADQFLDVISKCLAIAQSV